MKNQASKNEKHEEWLNAPTQASASGIAFSVASVLPTVLSVLFLLCVGSGDFSQTDWFLYVSYALPQIAFLITAVWFLYYLKQPIAQTLKNQKCKPRYFLLAFLLQLGLFSLSELNALFLRFLGNFGYVDVGISLPSMDGFGFIGVLFVVAVLPAVFEEIMFRGVLLNGLKSFGKTGAVLLCGALFALYHQNPAQTLYQFCCGVAFALIALRAGSVLPTVFSHFLNNALILTLAKFGVESFPVPVAIVLLTVSVICLTLSLVWLFVWDKKREEMLEAEAVDKSERKRFFLCASVGIAICVLAWIAVLFSGL